MMKQLLRAGLLLAGFGAQAQSSPTAPAPLTRLTRTTITANTPPEQRAEQVTTRLTRQLKLTPEQLPRVQAAALAQAQAKQAVLRKHNGMSSHETLGQEMEAVDDGFAAQLKSILTAAQYEQYTTSQTRLRQIREQAAGTPK